MNRKDLQALSRIRAREAKALLAAGLYDGAYYLAGYAVECALKACIAKTTHRHDFPDKERVNRSYTHRLEELIRIAGLEEPHAALMQSDPAFHANWDVAKSWSEDSRYRQIEPKNAKALVAAILEGRSGILAWLRHYW